MPKNPGRERAAGAEGAPAPTGDLAEDAGAEPTIWISGAPPGAVRAVPDEAVPEVGVADVAVPDDAGLEATGAELAVPDVEVPDVAVPDETVPAVVVGVVVVLGARVVVVVSGGRVVAVVGVGVVVVVTGSVVGVGAIVVVVVGLGPVPSPGEVSPGTWSGRWCAHAGEAHPRTTRAAPDAATDSLTVRRDDGRCIGPALLEVSGISRW